MLPLFVRADQINVVLPRDAPLGQASIQVTYQGAKSNPIPVKIVASNPGLHAVSSGGFGPGVVRNFVDGKTAHRLYSGRSPCCSGVDQISLEVPADVPTGCYVPVQIRTAGTTLSNTVTVAIFAGGSPCAIPTICCRPSSAREESSVSSIWKGATCGLSLSEKQRWKFRWMRVFRSEVGGEFSFNPLIDLPPLGTCSVFGVRGDLVGANWLPGVTATKAELDVGHRFT